MLNSPSLFRCPPVRVLLGSSIFASMTVNGAPPAWWSAGDPPVWNESLSGGPVVNRGVVNIGQAKHMVARALEVLESVDEDVADEIRLKLTTPQPSALDPNQTNPAILDLSVPSPKTPAWIEKQKAPLLIGQLKAIAAPFYDVLHAENPTWLEAQLVENGTKDTASTSNHYPWSENAADDANRATANIGQLKAVFSLDFEELDGTPTSGDSDGDGLPDDWEEANGLHPDDDGGTNADNGAGGDPDGDGMTNLTEFGKGLNPKGKDNPKVLLRVTE